MKKFLKILLIVVAVILLGFLGLYLGLRRDMPAGEAGAKAEETADKMLEALNYEELKGLKRIRWSFRGEHHYDWNKQTQRIDVKWGQNHVRLDLGSGEHEMVAPKGANAELKEKALAYFYNDSFWLLAPFKVKDPGTRRKYVEREQGHGLLVTYTTGGATPGDSYLWILDENYRPRAWRIWTSNVPIGGLKFDWTDWKQYKGVWLASSHSGPGPLDVETTDISVE